MEEKKGFKLKEKRSRTHIDRRTGIEQLRINKKISESVTAAYKKQKEEEEC